MRGWMKKISDAIVPIIAPQESMDYNEELEEISRNIREWFEKEDSVFSSELNYQLDALKSLLIGSSKNEKGRNFTKEADLFAYLGQCFAKSEDEAVDVALIDFYCSFLKNELSIFVQNGIVNKGLEIIFNQPIQRIRKLVYAYANYALNGQVDDFIRDDGSSPLFQALLEDYDYLIEFQQPLLLSFLSESHSNAPLLSWLTKSKVLLTKFHEMINFCLSGADDTDRRHHLLCESHTLLTCSPPSLRDILINEMNEKCIKPCIFTLNPILGIHRAFFLMSAFVNNTFLACLFHNLPSLIETLLINPSEDSLGVSLEVLKDLIIRTSNSLPEPLSEFRVYLDFLSLVPPHLFIDSDISPVLTKIRKQQQKQDLYQELFPTSTSCDLTQAITAVSGLLDRYFELNNEDASHVLRFFMDVSLVKRPEITFFCLCKAPPQGLVAKLEFLSEIVTRRYASKPGIVEEIKNHTKTKECDQNVIKLILFTDFLKHMQAIAQTRTFQRQTER